MRIAIIFVVIVFSSLYTYSCDNDERELFDSLYKTGSKELLDTFLSKWQRCSVPLNDTAFKLLTPIRKDIYLIYEDFLNKQITQRLSAIDYDKKNIKYFIIDYQTKVYLNIPDSILNHRKFKQKKIYLNLKSLMSLNRGLMLKVSNYYILLINTNCCLISFYVIHQLKIL